MADKLSAVSFNTPTMRTDASQYWANNFGNLLVRFQPKALQRGRYHQWLSGKPSGAGAAAQGSCMTERMVRSSLMVSATRASRTCHHNGTFSLHATLSHAALSRART